MEQQKHYTGLTPEEVLESRRQHGENILTPPEKEPIWKLFLEKFTDPIILILLVALLLSVGVACYEFFGEGKDGSVFFEPAGILLAILLATCVGFWFELSANKKFEILNQVNDDTQVKVIRSGNVCQIPRKEVVVGDIVLLETGEEVPADGQLLEAISLQVNESTLTGEPMIGKTTRKEDFDKDATYPSDQVMKGTTVADGHGIMRVTLVGDATEYGKVYQGSQIDNSVKTPLNRQLDSLGDFITKASYAIAALIIVGRLFVYFHNGNAEPTLNWVDFTGYLLQTAMIAVTVIVVAVPEGLPMSVTLSLALSMKRMLATNNLVRKMHACETMGACSVICTDKTGTLTENQMRIHETNFSPLGKEQKLKPDNDEVSRLLTESIAVNSTAYLDESEKGRPSVLGNPTEGALLLWLRGQNLNYAAVREECPVVEQLTFSTERKYMATVVESPVLKKRILYVKGAPEIIFGLCTTMLTPQGAQPAAPHKQEIEKQLLDYQNQAMRTLGFAYRVMEAGEEPFANGRIAQNDLCFLGIVAISDPVRSDVPAAVKSCLEAGIQVKIVTGDTPGTAKEIGRQIGIWDESATDRSIITGPDFAALSDAEVLDRVGDLRIMSRARPMDKQRLVKALQDRGEVVAVTGDGTNDAPALKAAHIGLSMGDGTSVAKEASAITIIDNSFASITRAVMWGRSLYQNIQRFIIFQMTINVVACLIVLIGAFLGTESPLTVTQMLWVNLIMDTFAAMALASLPPSERVMKEKPRNPEAFIITKPMRRIILGVGFIFVILLFGLLQYFKHYDVPTMTAFSFADFFSSFFDFSQGHNELTAKELSMFFTFFVFLQFWNMFNAKAFHTQGSAFSNLSHSKGFLSVSVLILLGQIVIVSLGGQMFNVTPLRLEDWGLLLLYTAPVLIVGEIYRLFKR
ncbi:MAG: calcium-translocating P-type ATPase, PMCA-type [Bacteroidaceae bacterium]|jgi:Ca2+-transporting ATPase